MTIGTMTAIMGCTIRFRMTATPPEFKDSQLTAELLQPTQAFTPSSPSPAPAKRYRVDGFDTSDGVRVRARRQLSGGVSGRRIGSSGLPHWIRAMDRKRPINPPRICGMGSMCRLKTSNGKASLRVIMHTVNSSQSLYDKTGPKSSHPGERAFWSIDRPVSACFGRMLFCGRNRQGVGFTGMRLARSLTIRRTTRWAKMTI